VDAVCTESARRAASGGGAAPAGFALCRPPGHHALPKSAMGFCLFSNAALAARHAQAVHGLQRVLIYDFDVHHGNGTADTFAADPDVLYISTHQDGSYPGTGTLLETGTGAGEGASLNVPLPGGAGDVGARAALEEVIGPAAERFKPDIILVSAGYDAHWCALNACTLCVRCMQALTRVM
jgi:acetoin utilization deacetylase AcuC-like enzyme